MNETPPEEAPLPPQEGDGSEGETLEPAAEPAAEPSEDDEPEVV
jgi:hypothetical protein